MNGQLLYEEVGKLIASRRRQLGQKQDDIAKLAGVSRASLANIEVGRQRVLLHQLYNIARALQFDGPQPLLPTMRAESVNDLPMSRSVTSKQAAQLEQLISSASKKAGRP